MATCKNGVRLALRIAVTLPIAVLCGHVAISSCTRIQPPPLSPAPSVQLETLGGTRRVGRSYVKRHGKILQVGLEGDVEQIGLAHALLLHGEMVACEEALWSILGRVVPLAPARVLLFDLARLRFRNIDRTIGEARRYELAASARAFSPDPYDDILPIYSRLIFLNALYDISLSFERSPLLGCSSVVLTGPRSADGHTLVGRNFDFDIHSVFDVGKAVLLIREEGKIPFASVGWPGLVGVVTGMNAEGLALAIHGARASSFDPEGEPALLTLRDTLATARTTPEAIDVLSTRRSMVSHLVVVADGAGRSAVLERVPGTLPHVRMGTTQLVVTNHLEGPSANDPSNQDVLARTSSAIRRSRLDELAARLDHPATPTDVLGMIRDRKAPGGVHLTPGDRRAIDADIAAHGVVMDVTSRRLWVSEGPHLRGRFVRFDLSAVLDAAYDPDLQDPLDPLSVDVEREP